MPNTGDSFRVRLQTVHLNWGTTSSNGQRNRHPDEAYIPIPMSDAIRLGLFNNGSCFSVSGQNFQVKATGTQGSPVQYGKNLSSSGNLRLLGAYLKRVLNAQPGDTAIVSWLSPTEVSIEIDTSGR
ncbi:hypothetical protein WS9_008420 [Paraclostridium sordellii 8483]|uniref:hypothetical protein n=1 Tax=Paraclostridium sordellii TaxID=1505 RepID=UPI00030AC67B|nr:hypothetical protein [Paeniclostridium sordellii]TAN67417.1 hypothetical protein WS9_008420 [Paeniclostridium sordellii 8483]